MLVIIAAVSVLSMVLVSLAVGFVLAASFVLMDRSLFRRPEPFDEAALRRSRKFLVSEIALCLIPMPLAFASGANIAYHYDIVQTGTIVSGALVIIGLLAFFIPMFLRYLFIAFWMELLRHRLHQSPSERNQEDSMADPSNYSASVEDEEKRKD